MAPASPPADGFITAAPNGPIQAEFRGLVAQVSHRLSQQFPNLLDGLYLYGSVARGDAKAGTSDLDLTLVLQRPASAQEQADLECLRQTLAAQHPEVLKIDFDIGLRAEVLAPEHRASWGYWLKHHCRCLWGNDLSTHFTPFKPSRAIAIAVNGDFASVLLGYADRIDGAGQSVDVPRWQREAARKLIRSTNLLRTEQEPRWPASLEEHAELFVEGYPAMAAASAFFLQHARHSAAPVPGFSQRLREFTRWLQAAHQDPSTAPR